MSIKAFIFDLDGVITETAEFHYEAWKALCKQMKWTFNRTINEKLRGVSRIDSIKIILKENDCLGQYSEEKIENIANQKNQTYVRSLDKITPEDYIEGVKELLETLKTRGYKIGLGSASKNARKVLKQLQAIPYFEVIDDGNSVVKSKPAPDIFLYTAEKLGVQPKDCIVVEDAESGVDAAIAGGFKSIGIGPENRVGHATFQFENMKSINIEKVLNS